MAEVESAVVTTTILPSDPLYYNPSEGTQTLKITPELTGFETYGPWKRQMELALSAKRKLGYVTGLVTRDASDVVKQDAWDTSNNLVISWIFQNVSERIKSVILYGQSAKEIWDTLARRYTGANGARKFRLNKGCYEVEQGNKSVEEYYTELQGLWDELENMNTLPVITQKTTEIVAYLKALEEQAEEKRLFQFLNGLSKEYAMLRSNILLMNPLPSVENAVSMLFQEETQTGNTTGIKKQEVSVFLSKGEYGEEACKHCGRKNHRSDMCWEVVGYPVGHPKNKKFGGKVGFKGQGNYKNQGTFGRQGYGGGGNYNQNNFRQTGGQGFKGPRKMAATVKTEQMDLAAAIGNATHQLESLLRMVPGNNNSSSSKTGGGDTDEELECNFAGM